MSEGKGYSLSQIDRTRWNVVDLVSVVGGDAVRSYILDDIDMSWAEKLQQELKKRGEKVTVTAILLKAIGIAQRSHPTTRTGYLPFGRRVTFNNIVAGVTIERRVDSKASVFFGIIDAPDSKPIEQIARELKYYKDEPIDSMPQLRKERFFSFLPVLLRRIGIWFGMTFPSLRLKVNPATFGISSLGKYGASAVFGPCVCTATIGVGTVEERLVVKEGKVEVRSMMTLSLSFDQRVLDALPAARFMQDVKELLEGGLEKYIASNNSFEAIPSQG